MTAPIVHIIGPGGAGKSRVGPRLAKNLGWTCIDLDEYFLATVGRIATFIESQGYTAYAKRNVRNYFEIASGLGKPLVVVLSSGFMTYPVNVGTQYPALRDEVERHPLSLVLLPSFNFEECVRIIVDRQLQRPYLAADRKTEEARIRNRLPIFMALRCKRFLSVESPARLALQLEAFVTANSALNGDVPSAGAAPAAAGRRLASIR